MDQKNLIDFWKVVQDASLGASTADLDQLLGQALDALSPVIPFDLATIMELDGNELRVRVARGPLDGPKIRRHRIRLSDFPSIQHLLEKGHARAFLERDHAEGDGDPFDGVLDLVHGHSCMVVPLCAGSKPQGIMTFDRDVCGPYTSGITRLAEVYGRLLAVTLIYGEQTVRLNKFCSRLESQNRRLRQGLDELGHAGRLVESCASDSMSHVTRMARQVAGTDTPVLITGETGTGKGVLAQAIHDWSSRSSGPLVVVNCAALPRELLESELFGHVKGAFTGATHDREGRFKAADGGTMFLDEIGELPVELQAKMLRVLQEGCFEPVGSSRTARVDVRIIAATNLDLKKAIPEHRFREDLYYRLAVFPIHLPPLRARIEDIPIIAGNFLEKLARKSGRGPWAISASQMRLLSRHGWPGNIRELLNTLERATILARDGDLDLDSSFAGRVGMPDSGAETDDSGQFASLSGMERRHILAALRKTGGKIYGEGGAAELLDINPNTLRSRMRKHGLSGAREFRRGG